MEFLNTVHGYYDEILALVCYSKYTPYSLDDKIQQVKKLAKICREILTGAFLNLTRSRLITDC